MAIPETNANRDQKKDSWRTVRASNSVVLFSLIFFLAVAVSIELMLRIPAAGVPYPVKGFDAADEMFRALDSHIAEKGEVNCIFLGSSLVYVGIQPHIFEDAYYRQAGESIRCFTFGVSSATASSIGPLAQILVNRYDPDLLIWGTQARDFTGVANEPEALFPSLPWTRYHLGDFNMTGLFEEMSVTYRYLETIPNRLADDDNEESPIPESSQGEANRPDSVVSKTAAGYQPLLFFASGSPLDSIKQDFEPVRRVETKAFEAMEGDLEGFTQFLALSTSIGTKLLIVEMPMPTRFYVDYSQAPTPTRQQVMQSLRDQANRQGVPFWLAGESDILPVTVYTDPLHMHAMGSFAFSDWLGVQVGETAAAGWPEDNLSKTPLEVDPALPRQECYGLSAQKWQVLQNRQTQFEQLPPDAVIFNPRNTVDREQLQITAGMFIEYRAESQGEADETYYDLMALQERMVFAEELQAIPQSKQLLADWSAEPNAAKLQAVGVDYVLLTELWSSPDTAPEIYLGEWSDGYRLAAWWDYTPMQETYFLYAISTQ